MTNPHSLPDYKNYFETKSLDKIHGKPNLHQLIKIFRQLKRNAQRIPTRLGGGRHGYLALLLSTEKYNAITGTAAFTRPTDPGVFTPRNITTSSTSASTGVSTRASAAEADAATTATAPTTRTPNSAELAQQKAAYDERLRLYLEVRTVETLLRNLFLEALDDEYIQAL